MSIVKDGDSPQVALARDACTKLRDFARAHGMHHFERDPLVMAIHRALDEKAGGVPSQPTDPMVCWWCGKPAGNEHGGPMACNDTFSIAMHFACAKKMSDFDPDVMVQNFVIGPESAGVPSPSPELARVITELLPGADQ